MAVQQAPDFTLPHVSGREVSLSEFRGRPAVLVFSGRDSKDQAASIESAIRGRYAADELALISVANVKGVPRLLHGVAKNDIEKSYKKTAQETAKRLQESGKPVPADLSGLVVFLLDWNGKAVSDYGADGKQAVAVLIDAGGNIQGRASGAEAGSEILSMLGQG